MLNGYPVELFDGTEVEINDEKYSIIPAFQEVLTETSYNTEKSMKDMEKLVFGDILQKTD